MNFILYTSPKLIFRKIKYRGLKYYSDGTGEIKTCRSWCIYRCCWKIGLIRDISKYVIENVIKQIKIWEKENISIHCSINLTAQELTDQELIEWAVGKIESHDIDRSMIEIEITERVLNKEFEKLISTLSIWEKLVIKYPLTILVRVIIH